MIPVFFHPNQSCDEAVATRRLPENLRSSSRIGKSIS